VNLLILGADSPVGQALVEALVREDQVHTALATEEFLSLQKPELVKTLSRLNPTQVIYVASFDDIAAAESDADAARRCDQVNTLGAAEVAEVCQKLQVPLLHHSSSQVFDGRKVHPYREEDETNPQSRYGQSKLGAERAIRELLPTHVILRTDWVFDTSKSGYFENLLTSVRQNEGKLVVRNQRFCPTPSADVARVLLGITRQVDCQAEVWGVYHYCALQPVAQETFVEQVIQEAAKYDPELSALLPQLQISKEAVEAPWIANSVVGTQKIFETFGIKQRSRAAALTAVLQKLCNYTPPETPATAEVSVEAPPPAPAPAQEGERNAQPRRKLKKKSGSAKPGSTDAKRTP
jgi:dTDP-4-dehydrorhamnose reductase